MSDSVRPHRRQPTRLPHPWDSPGKNTGVGHHFLLQCMKVKSESEVAQSCLTLSDPMGCSPRGSPIHGIFLVRVLEWGAIAFSTAVLTAVNSLTHIFLLIERKLNKFLDRSYWHNLECMCLSHCFSFSKWFNMRNFIPFSFDVFLYVIGI